MVKTRRSRTAATASPDPLVENSMIAKMAKIAKAFNCPVCLTLPPYDIYQCNEGHLICKDCYNKLKSKSPVLCPTCCAAMPGVPIRNRAAEKVKVQYFLD